MKIVKLETENIKRIKAIEIKPDGSLVIIGGKNAQGKTSVLDSIEYVLGGTSKLPPRPIRDGAKQGKIFVDLGELKVTRIITAKTNQLIIENKEGGRESSPQALLDKLTGKLTFDPLEFSRMNPKLQQDTLKTLLGLDFSTLDDAYNDTFTERTIVNRTIKTAEGQLVGFPDASDSVPDHEVSISSLIVELEERQKHNAQNERTLAAYDDFILEDESFADHMSDLFSAKARIEKELDEGRKRMATNKKETEAAREAADKLVDADVEEVRDQINSAEEINAQVRSNAAYKEKKAELFKLKEKSSVMSDVLEANRQERIDQLSNTDMPVEGLGLTEEGVVFQGLPFEQCSSSEQLKVSVAMGLAMNPKLRILLIRDGSLLDNENLKIIAEMAAAADAQVWIERVGEGKEATVIIEDGMVKEEEGAK